MIGERTLLHRILRKLNRHRTTDLYFVGYPKTGNTWVTYMLGRYIQLLCDLPELPLFDTTDPMGRCQRFCVGPRIQFTHRPLHWDAQRADDLSYDNVVRPFEDKRVILIARHPLDTLVSHWLYRKHRMDQHGRRVWQDDLDLNSFVEDPVWGIEKFFRFYSLWHENRARVKRVSLLRYEDIRAEPKKTFALLLQSLQIPQQEDKMRQAIADADFENMRKVEKSGEAPKLQSSGYSIFGTADRSNPEAFHVRRGKVGGFQDYFEQTQIGPLLDRINRRLPEFFGYSSERRC